MYYLSINNNSMPNLEKMSINNFSLLNVLSNNNLSSISNLDISKNNIQFIQGNIFQQLTRANFSHNPLNIFQISAPKLTTLDICN